MNVQNLNANDVVLPGSGRPVSEFTKTMEVKRDLTTGTVIGWDDFFAHIEQSAPKD